MIPVGTQYYRQPTPKPEFWEADFKLMNECGFNTIRGWAMWSWLNPKKGIYDFTEVDRLLDIGHKYDIKVILLINIESSPGWLYKNHPDKLYVDRLGNHVKPHTVHNTAIGGFPGQCLDYPEIISSSLPMYCTYARTISSKASRECAEIGIRYAFPVVLPAICISVASISGFALCLNGSYS